MKLDTAVKIFEIFSALAVLVTLVILVLEVRENTVAVQRSTFNQVSNNQILWRKTMLENDKLFDSYFNAVRKGQPLDEKETDRVRVYTEMLWITYEQAFFSYRAELLGETEWKRFEKWICIGWSPPQEVWNVMALSLSSEFVLYVEQCRKDHDQASDA